MELRINGQDKLLTDVAANAAAIATNTTNIGDLAYTENNYITDSEPLTESVDKLDMAVNDNAAQISQLGADVLNNRSSAINKNTVDNPAPFYPVENSTINVSVVSDTDVLIARHGVNCFDGVIESGTIKSSGAPIPNVTMIRSANFIPVLPSSSIIVHDENNTITDTSIACFFYTDAFAFISADYHGKTTAPANARYYKFRAVSTDLSLKWQAEYGTIATDLVDHAGNEVKTISVSGGIGSTTFTGISGVNIIRSNAGSQTISYNKTADAETYDIRHSVGISTIKNWAAVGDSLTSHNASATKNYTDLVADSLNLNCVNMGKGGTGYMQESDADDTFHQRITASLPADANVVTIFGSINDLSLVGASLGTATDTGVETIGGCINAAIDAIYAKIPTARLGVITPTPVYSTNPATPNDLITYANLIIDVCKLRGVPCLDLYRSSNLRPWDATQNSLWYENDETANVHPNDAGHEMITPAIREFIRSLI